MKTVVLVSGTGSILESMLGVQMPIDLVVADRECRGLSIMDGMVPTAKLPRVFGPEFDRRQYTLDMVALLRRHQIGLVVMAGFMTVFDGAMFEEGGYPNRVINIHPSLLPAFKGDHAVRDALAFGVKVTGTTIHYATAELDNGPIIAQEAVPVLPGDTEATLHERIKVVERRLYPATVIELLRTLPC